MLFILLAIIFLYSSICVLFYLLQNKLLYKKQKISIERLNYIKNNYKNTEEVSLKSNDNYLLHGWFVKNESNPNNIIIYFAGNAEEISYMIEYSKHIDNYSFVLINYRGYGLSEGNPNESNLFNDSILIYDYFLNNKNIKNIVVMGRSLGTGVAVYLATKRKIDKLILSTPFDSIENMAKKEYPFLPANFLLKDKYNSIKSAYLISSKVLVIIAENDKFVPIQFSMNLASKLKDVTVKIIKNENHSTIVNNKTDYLAEINNFLKND